ncbi:hypothetical protein G9C98_001522 [Cotesia typhae]|uniref:Uncharacterized protein n=1 Tax=Cotesia typhae TaxID=2053667 RepID=A0A8J5R7K3_9HYME|nr:hypothetical protein G9C98_001522 [Cotesia typhae]
MRIVEKACWEDRKRIEREKKELQILQEKCDDLKAREVYNSHQSTSANNAQVFNFSNVDNSYQHQINSSSAQSLHVIYFSNPCHVTVTIG